MTKDPDTPHPINPPAQGAYVTQGLAGRFAVIAGATRGAGRGIAATLGEAGATVIRTGRSSSTVPLWSDYDRGETIEEKIQAIIETLQYGRYRCTPVRRAYIDKRNSSMKSPLGFAELV